MQCPQQQLLESLDLLCPAVAIVMHQACVCFGVPFRRDKSVKFSATFGKWLRTESTYSFLPLPLKLVKFAPLGRSSPLVELKPLRDIAAHLVENDLISS